MSSKLKTEGAGFPPETRGNDTFIFSFGFTKKDESEILTADESLYFKIIVYI